MTFRPLLAATCDDSNIHLLKYPLLASPKLDGIRVLIKDGVAYTRSMKPVRNKRVQAILGHEKFNGLDGEICAGNVLDPKCFRNTTTAVMAENSNVEWTYWVFDNYLVNNSFFHRLLTVEELCEQASLPYLKLVAHRGINSIEDLETYEQLCLSQGFEGTMLRDPHGRYKNNRSTFNEGILLKLKRGQMVRGDAIVLGFTERMENHNEAYIDERGFTKRSVHKENMVGRGDLGSLQVKDDLSGEEFSIGTGEGLDDALRQEIWNNKEAYLGRSVRYEWFKYGAYDKPRHPKFVCFRSKEDMSEG